MARVRAHPSFHRRWHVFLTTMQQAAGISLHVGVVARLQSMKRDDSSGDVCKWKQQQQVACTTSITMSTQPVYNVRITPPCSCDTSCVLHRPSLHPPPRPPTVIHDNPPASFCVILQHTRQTKSSLEVNILRVTPARR